MGAVVNPTAGATLHLGDCRQVLPDMPAESADVVFTDPPYPCVNRDYGYWTEPEWFDLMEPVVHECMRILKPTGSAVFVLQPSSRRVGRMRLWLWEFMLWVGKEYGIVQDAYWWNPTTPPTVHVQRTRGGLRPSVKACVWVGSPGCYRNQANVLWEPSDAAKAVDRSDRVLRQFVGGQSMRPGRCATATDERGGVTPFNLLPIPNTDSRSSAGAHGHRAGTPVALASWWIRYLCPPGGVVLDPFSGSGTTGLAAAKHGSRYIGIEVMPAYHKIAVRRLCEKG